MQPGEKYRKFVFRRGFDGIDYSLSNCWSDDSIKEDMWIAHGHAFGDCIDPTKGEKNILEVIARIVKIRVREHIRELAMELAEYTKLQEELATHQITFFEVK